MLLRARTIADRGKHHAAIEAQLHWAIELARGYCSHRRVRPWKKLSAEARTEKARDYADIFDRQAEHLRHHHAMIHNPLRSLVERDAIAVPHRDGGMQLDRIVRFNRRDVGLHRS